MERLCSLPGHAIKGTTSWQVKQSQGIACRSAVGFAEVCTCSYAHAQTFAKL